MQALFHLDQSEPRGLPKVKYIQYILNITLCPSPAELNSDHLPTLHNESKAFVLVHRFILE